jgi:hypothetical protein
MDAQKAWITYANIIPPFDIFVKKIKLATKHKLFVRSIFQGKNTKTPRHKVTRRNQLMCNDL